jgi:hypothetical protein
MKPANRAVPYEPERFCLFPQATPLLIHRNLIRQGYKWKCAFSSHLGLPNTIGILFASATTKKMAAARLAGRCAAELPQHSGRRRRAAAGSGRRAQRQLAGARVLLCGPATAAPPRCLGVRHSGGHFATASLATVVLQQVCRARQFVLVAGDSDFSLGPSPSPVLLYKLRTPM